jgi:predicted MFS family arabinose efflux permease
VSATTAAAGEPTSWRGLFAGARGRLVLGLLTIEFVGAVQALVTVAILPIVTASLGHPRLAPWTFTASSIAAIAAFAVAGRWVDRAGPRVALGTGLPLTAVGLGVAALAPTMAVLVGARALEGFGLGLQGTVALSTVATMFPPAARPRLLALTSTMWVLPGVVAPGLGVALAATVGWRWVFAGFLPLLGVAAALAIPPLRTLTPATAAGSAPVRPPMTAGAVASRLALAVGAAAMLAVLQVPGGRGVELVLGLAGLTVFAQGLRILARAELRGAHGRRLSTAMIAGFCVGGAYFGTDSVLPLVVHAHGGSTYVAGLALTAASLTWAAGSVWQTRLVRAHPLRAVLAAGAMVMAVGILATSLAQARSDGRWIIAVPFTLGLTALGMGFAYPTVSLLAVGGDQTDRTAADAGTADAAGLVLLAGSLGPAVTIGSLGVLASTGGRTGETVSALVLVSVALGAAVVAGASRRHRGGAV